MAGFDLAAARLVRLRQDVDALLSNEDPQAREDIFRLLAIGAGAGLDLFPRFRAMVAPWLGTPVPHHRAGADASDGLEMEALPERQQGKRPGCTVPRLRPRSLGEVLSVTSAAAPFWSFRRRQTRRTESLPVRVVAARSLR
jgi:hypothetical protein